MDELIRAALAGEEAYVVGGAVRDEALGRPVLDVDVACPSRRERRVPIGRRPAEWCFSCPSATAPGGSRRRTAAPSTSRCFAARSRTISPDGTSPSTPSRGRSREATRSTRTAAVTTWPLVRSGRSPAPSSPTTHSGCCVQCGSKTSSGSASTRKPRLSSSGSVARRGVCRRAHPRGAPAALPGRVPAPGGARPARAARRRRAPLARADPADLPPRLLVAALGRSVERLPSRTDAARADPSRRERPARTGARSIHRFRRRTEPWALAALAFLGRDDLADAVLAARAAEPSRAAASRGGVELGVQAGPEVGRLLELVAEERAVGTIQHATRRSRSCALS